MPWPNQFWPNQAWPNQPAQTPSVASWFVDTVLQSTMSPKTLAENLAEPVIVSQVVVASWETNVAEMSVAVALFRHHADSFTLKSSIPIVQSFELMISAVSVYSALTGSSISNYPQISASTGSATPKLEAFTIFTINSLE